MSFEQGLLLCLAMLLVGISKTGFGGSVGILAMPMIAAVLPPRVAAGVMLPLLIACDLIAFWLYRREIDWRSINRVWFGTFAGVAAGAACLALFSDQSLRSAIGILCLLFCAIQGFRTYILKVEAQWQPNWVWGSITGLVAGFTSTLAHAAGPVMTMYLLPQKLPNAIFLGTTMIFFGILNLLKVPVYLQQRNMDATSLQLTLTMIPVVLAGAVMGACLNRVVKPDKFTKIVHGLLFLAGLELLGVRSFIFSHFP